MHGRRPLETPFPAYRGEESYIFVCYSHEDAAIVFPELIALRDSGLNIYYDEGIAPGHEWTQELADAIDGCSRFLYFVSPSSVSSRHCRNEVQYALEKTKSLISVYLEPTTLPGGLQLSLGSAQAIMKYALGADDYKRKLAQTFEIRAPDVDAIGDPSSSITTRRSWPIAIAIVAVCLLIAGGIRWSSSGGPSEKAQPIQVNADSLPTLAVLPFANMSDDPAQEYFSDGVSEDILTALARQGTLVVRARQSSFFFKGQEVDPRQIANALDVSYLVNGSVRMHGDRVRVTVRLTDVVSNADVWSSRYDRDLVDVFAVQDEIAEAVSTELGAQFSRSKRRAVDINAYDAYLLGRHYFHRQAFQLAKETLLKAIEHDGSYADAHALLARVYGTESWNQPSNLQELVQLQHRHIKAALALEPEHPLALGLRANSPTYPIQTAIDELHKLVSRFPNDEGLLFFYSTKMRLIGRSDLELAILERQATVDPLAATCPIPKMTAHIFYGQTSDASRGLELCEAAGVPYPSGAVHIALLKGDLETAKQEASRPTPDWFAVPSIWQPISRGLLAYVQEDSDDIELALSPVVEAIESQTYFVQFWVALLRGETATASQHYASALDLGEPLAFYLIQGPALDEKLFPDFWGSDKHFQMLRAYGLDSESIPKLNIPAFPF